MSEDERDKITIKETADFLETLMETRQLMKKYEAGATIEGLLKEIEKKP